LKAGLAVGGLRIGRTEDSFATHLRLGNVGGEKSKWPCTHSVRGGTACNGGSGKGRRRTVRSVLCIEAKGEEGGRATI